MTTTDLMLVASQASAGLATLVPFIVGVFSVRFIVSLFRSGLGS